MDDLTKIKGVGKAIAATLATLEITTFAALAAADADKLRQSGKFADNHDIAAWVAAAKVELLGAGGAEQKPVWRGNPVSVKLLADVEGMGTAGEIVTMPEMDAQDLRHEKKARRLLLSDL